VIRLSGRKLSDLQQGGRPDPLPYRLLKLVLCPEPRAELHRRIATRFQEMLEQGFEEEVRSLHARPDLRPEMPAMRAVGYRQAWAWLDGRLTASEWPEKALAATRQLAKRQLTWLRKESGALWYDSAAGGTRREVHLAVQEFLNSGT
jgi:tRNA dimethylallyltransferase